jgi:DNA-binding protein H-NS
LLNIQQVAVSTAASDEHQHANARHSKESQMVEQSNEQQQQTAIQGLTRDAATASSMLARQAAATATSEETLDDVDQASMEVLQSPASAATATGCGGSSNSSPTTDKLQQVNPRSPLRCVHTPMPPCELSSK